MVYESNEINLIKLQDGTDGSPGKDGESGKTLYTWVKYSQYADGTDLTDDPTDAIYIGIAYNKENQVESNNKSDYTWSKIKGDDGQDGANGNDGRGIEFTSITYQASSNGTTIPSGAWSTTIPTVSEGQYLWTRTIITYTDSTISTSYSISMMGSTGEAGKGVSKIVEQYYLSSSNTTQTDGSWSTTSPSWKSGYYIWTRSQITWTDDSITYTTPELANALNDANSTANNALNTVNNLEIGGRNLYQNTGLTKGTYNLGWWQATPTSHTDEIISDSATKSGKARKITYIEAGKHGPVWFFAGLEGKTYTGGYYAQSCMMKATNNITVSWGSEGLSRGSANLTASWKKFTFIAKSSNEVSLARAVSFYPVDNVPAGTELYIADYKMEEGNKATDWSPAPEDISVENIYTPNTTTIDGGKITTGSITANKINVKDLFAQDITATGTITGAKLYGTYIEAVSGSIGDFAIIENRLSNVTPNSAGVTISPKTALNSNEKAIAIDYYNDTGIAIMPLAYIDASGNEYLKGELSCSSINTNGVSAAIISANSVQAVYDVYANYGTDNQVSLLDLAQKYAIHAGNVEGQGFFYGSYTSPGNRYAYSGLQIRENGCVGNSQTDIGYAPSIGFHWGNSNGGTLSMGGDGIFYFRKIDGASRATIDANVNGTATGNAPSSATPQASTYTAPTATHGNTTTGYILFPAIRMAIQWSTKTWVGPLSRAWNTLYLQAESEGITPPNWPVAFTSEPIVTASVRNWSGGGCGVLKSGYVTTPTSKTSPGTWDIWRSGSLSDSAAYTISVVGIGKY